jgi:hypothetical protein
MYKPTSIVINKLLNKEYNISGRIYFRIFILFLLFTINTVCQVKTNMEIFYSLADSSVRLIVSTLPPGTKEVSVKLNLGSEYSVLGNKILSSFSQNGIKTDSSSLMINYIIDNASINYNDMFRNGIFSDYLVNRTVAVHGSYFIMNKGVTEFSITKKDTIPIDEVTHAESPSYSFTRGELPAEPFFSGLFEPVAAISAAAAAIILFFTVRSH